MRKNNSRSIGKYLFVGIAFLFFIFPFYILVINTFKSTSLFVKSPFSLPQSLDLSNYSNAITRMNFINSLKNTFVITFLATILNTLLASMTAFYFSRRKTRVNKVIFTLFLSSMVAPFQVYMIPLVRIFAGWLGLSNNLFTVIYISIGLNIPFAVFLYHGFIEGIPLELDEAAKIDGCNMYRTFFNVIFPLLKPIIITVTVFVALGIWNDYLMTSLFLTKNETKTLSIAAFVFLSNHTADYAPMMAGLVLSILPVFIFYIFGQQYIIEGVTAGSVKG